MNRKTIQKASRLVLRTRMSGITHRPRALSFLVLILIYGASAAEADVTLRSPTDGTTKNADLCPVAPCTAEFSFQVEVTGAPMDSVWLDFTPDVGSPLDQPLCVPADPIEGTPGCPDPPVIFSRAIRIGEGSWTAVARVTRGAVVEYSSPIRLTVLAPSTPPAGRVRLDAVEPNFGSPPLPLRDPTGGPDNLWRYDDNNGYHAFTPRASDVLIAALDFTSDTIVDLQGTSGTEHGIAKGYAGGDLSFFSNRFNGVTNDGEFTVEGTHFVRNGSASIVDIGSVNHGIAARENAVGSGFVLYSEESVHTRFAGDPPDGSNSDHLIAVKCTGIVPAGEVTLVGENFENNPLLEVYVAPIPYGEPLLLPESGLPTADWCPFQAEILERGSSPEGMSFLRVKIPEIPLQTPSICGLSPGPAGSVFDQGWRWLIRDPWIRPERVHEWWAIPSPRSEGGVRNDDAPFKMVRPAYPLVYGFGFENESQDATLDEFLAVYGDNAYLCVGAFGLCATHVPDPLYWGAWLPIYKYLWIDDSGGSCVGMSATSLLMYAGDLRPQDFDPDVYYPAGFDVNAKPAVWINDGLLGNFSGPPEPGNLWAHIRKNHGVQTSAEFIWHFVADSGPAAAWPPTSGDPVARLYELGAQPIGQVISMNDGGGGHTVTPYAVRSDVPSPGKSTILIYDNNDPIDDLRTIVVDRDANTYHFEKASGGGVRDGNRIMTAPLSVFRNERHMPGIDDILPYIYLFIAGEADALYTTTDGGEWGFRSDGTAVANSPGPIAFPPIHNSLTEVRNMPFLLPLDAQMPAIQLNGRGGEYLFHAACGGNVLQLEVRETAEAEIAHVEPFFDGERVRSFRYTPEHDAGAITPRIGMVTGERERALFNWTGLTVAAGGSAEFVAVQAERGTVYRNDTGAATTHTLVLYCADGESGNSSTCVFGPFEVPEGAAHRVTIVDWPQATTLLSEIDLNRDGIPDEVAEVGGVTCGLITTDLPADEDRDGLPDDCESALPEKPVQHSPINDRDRDDARDENMPPGCGAGLCGAGIGPMTIMGLLGLRLIGFAGLGKRNCRR